MSTIHLEAGLDSGLRRFEPPALEGPEQDFTVLDWVVWAVVIGGSFALALAYAAYCTSQRGNPNISFGWGGFKVTCNR